MELTLGDHLTQAWIFIFGGISIWMVGRTETWRKWGYLIGLISQPAFIYMTIRFHMWGNFCLAVWYTYSWWQGTNNFIIKPYQSNVKKTD